MRCFRPSPSRSDGAYLNTRVSNWCGRISADKNQHWTRPGRIGYLLRCKKLSTWESVMMTMTPDHRIAAMRTAPADLHVLGVTLYEIAPGALSFTLLIPLNGCTAT